MFENLTNKFEEVFSSLKKAPSLDEKQVDEGLRGIRQALLEADVTLDVAKQFIENVKPKALGQEIIRSTSPGQMVVKIVYDELVKLLGEKNEDINLNAVPPVPMMLVGLQGSGKTTTTAKLSKLLEKNKTNYFGICFKNNKNNIYRYYNWDYFYPKLLFKACIPHPSMIVSKKHLNILNK